MDFVVLLVPAVEREVPLARLLPAEARLAVEDLLVVDDLAADRLDSIGPFDADRAADDRVPLAELRVELRAGALVPARVFFALLRDLEDFFVRAAMTVSSRE